MTLRSRVALLLFALLALSLVASKSTQAAVDVTFDNSNPNANPDGTFPAGARSTFVPSRTPMTAQVL